MKKNTHQDGITLLITLLLMGVLLAISGSLLNITLKQYQISGIALSSETAFHAANAGMECAQYWDKYEADNGVVEDAFAIGNNEAEITCMGIPDGNSIAAGAAASGVEQKFEFSWGSPDVCTKLSIYKFREELTDDSNSEGILMTDAGIDSSRRCAEGLTCTVIQSRGYNSSCNDISNPRIVERELTLIY